jgi:hypothetical protein
VAAVPGASPRASMFADLADNLSDELEGLDEGEFLA